MPGAVVHLYRWRGTHRAARIDRKHAVLSDVVVSAAMLSDHGMRPYFEALGEVRAVNASTEDPPPWQPFGASETCACCHSRFTWHCTSRSETTAYREKHHCRARARSSATRARGVSRDAAADRPIVHVAAAHVCDRWLLVGRRLVLFCLWGGCVFLRVKWWHIDHRGPRRTTDHPRSVPPEDGQAERPLGVRPPT